MPDPWCDVTTDENERQLERHGFTAFPAAFYNGDLVNNNVIWHWHDEMELILICRGIIVAGAGGTTVRLTAGEGCFIKAGALHNIWKEDHQPCEYHSVVFHPRVIGSMDSIFWMHYIEPLREPNFPQMIPFLAGNAVDFQMFFSRLWQVEKNQNIGYENDIRYLLTQFVAQLSNTPAEKERQLSERETRDMERMKVMLSFLEAHYAEELTLEQIAESAGVSVTECMRCFRRSIGVPPIRFLKERRLQRAADLLRHTQRNISDIAASCGFLDMSYFTKAFRQIYGMTPTVYRSSG